MSDESNLNKLSEYNLFWLQKAISYLKNIYNITDNFNINEMMLDDTSYNLGIKLAKIREFSEASCRILEHIIPKGRS